MRFRFRVGGRVEAVDVERAGTGWTVRVGGAEWTADLQAAGTGWSLLLGRSRAAATSPAHSHDVRVAWTSGDTAHVVVDGAEVTVSVAQVSVPGRPSFEHGAGDRVVRAPMPGRIVRVPVTVGQVVTARQPVLVVEAMKMENELRAPRAGTIRALHVAAGDPVDAGQVLVELDS